MEIVSTTPHGRVAGVTKALLTKKKPVEVKTLIMVEKRKMRATREKQKEMKRTKTVKMTKKVSIVREEALKGKKNCITV